MGIGQGYLVFDKRDRPSPYGIVARYSKREARHPLTGSSIVIVDRNIDAKEEDEEAYQKLMASLKPIA
jgi:hypothetical protein